MESLKQSYLRIEFLSLTVNGALGRSNTYSESATDAEKSKFRDSLCMELLKCEKLYLKRVSEADHLKSIIDLSTTLSQRFSPCLKGGCFRIGIAQKALNLYLKYLWCIGIIEEPLIVRLIITSSKRSLVIKVIPGPQLTALLITRNLFLKRKRLQGKRLYLCGN